MLTQKSILSLVPTSLHTQLSDYSFNCFKTLHILKTYCHLKNIKWSILMESSFQFVNIKFLIDKFVLFKFVYLQFPKRRWSGASRLGDPHLDGDWYRLGGIFWRLWGGSSKLLPSKLLPIKLLAMKLFAMMESIESERSRPATMAAAAAVHSAKRLFTMALRRSVSVLKKKIRYKTPLLAFFLEW